MSLDREQEKLKKQLEALRKIQDNKRCANCASLAVPYICIDFGTFICTRCSAIHREFAYRVKSITGSKWKAEEVANIQGNKHDGELYFVGWNSQQFPLPNASNDDTARARDFIQMKYETRRWTQEAQAQYPSGNQAIQEVNTQELAQVQQQQQPQMQQSSQSNSTQQLTPMIQQPSMMQQQPMMQQMYQNPMMQQMNQNPMMQQMHQQQVQAPQQYQLPNQQPFTQAPPPPQIMQQPIQQEVPQQAVQSAQQVPLQHEIVQQAQIQTASQLVPPAATDFFDDMFGPTPSQQSQPVAQVQVQNTVEQPVFNSTPQQFTPTFQPQVQQQQQPLTQQQPTFTPQTFQPAQHSYQPVQSQFQPTQQTFQPAQQSFQPNAFVQPQQQQKQQPKSSSFDMFADMVGQASTQQAPVQVQSNHHQQVKPQAQSQKPKISGADLLDF
ncbi:putative GTPase activating protein for ARF [Spironucleus salmonicida]|uniref:Arf GTP activating protein n=1 Tax=Spironucleus salmonicida TaxID=348837 RepID=V6LWH8_9EUKA|nr:putative GTPase activating protein for ARF [Spironucleus salmonicida]|eukprot:EST48603.1 Arf GTP activating protein [Spironucleus salmonicida]